MVKAVLFTAGKLQTHTKLVLLIKSEHVE